MSRKNGKWGSNRRIVRTILRLVRKWSRWLGASTSPSANGESLTFRIEWSVFGVRRFPPLWITTHGMYEQLLHGETHMLFEPKLGAPTSPSALEQRMGCTNNPCMAKLQRHSNQSGAEPRTPNSSRVVGKIADMPKQFKCPNFSRATATWVRKCCIKCHWRGSA